MRNPAYRIQPLIAAPDQKRENTESREASPYARIARAFFAAHEDRLCPYFSVFLLPHLARAAFAAAFFRCAVVMVTKRRFPPTIPPLRPIAAM